MSYLGRFKLGEYVPIHAFCVTSGAVEVAPTAAPTFTVYKTTDTAIVSAVKMAPSNKGIRTGWFGAEIFLDSTYSAGRYHGLISWASGGSSYAQQFCFTVTAGGHTTGQYLGMFFYRRPHADYVVGLANGGTLEFRRNPKAD